MYPEKYYQEEEDYINNILIPEVEKFKPFGGKILWTTLLECPDNLIVILHFHDGHNDNIRRVPVKVAKHLLDDNEKVTRVSCVGFERLYDGSIDNFRPCALLEIPSQK